MLKNIQELIKFRTLLWALVIRHLATRYRGSVLGFLWSFLNPLCLMLVYLLVFRYYIRFTQVQNYTVFMFAGLLPWIWFTSALSEGTSSIVGSGHLITKSMFPAHVLPTVATITTLINFLLSIPILVLMMLFTGVTLSPTLLFLPVIIFTQFVFILGLNLLLSSLNVQFRDVQHIVGNLLTFLFFLCPIVYPPEAVPARFKWTIDLNPLAQLTCAYQDVILNDRWPALHNVAYMAAWALLAFVLGNSIYEKKRESFAELL